MFENDSNIITLKLKYSTDENSKTQILEYIKNYNNVSDIQIILMNSYSTSHSLYHHLHSLVVHIRSTLYMIQVNLSE